MSAAAEVIGFDHVYLAVSSVARAEPFYDRLLVQALGFRKSAFSLGGEPHVQYYNRLFGIVLRPARGPSRPHDAYAPGLHHLCLRVDGEADVDRVAAALVAAGLAPTPPRLYPEYAPDYRATFIEDPDGLRLEITNFRAERRERLARWDNPPGGRVMDENQGADALVSSGRRGPRPGSTGRARRHERCVLRCHE